jgi:hypothetical protein
MGRNQSRNVASEPDTVEQFLSVLDHPQKDEIVAIRNLILAADPTISEGIKWKVPSFCTSEYFATMHLRAKTGIGVILHFGVKKRDNELEVSAIADPAGMLKWLAKDRAMITFEDMSDISARAPASPT